MQLTQERDALPIRGQDVSMRSRRETLDARLAYWVQRFDAVEIIDPLKQSPSHVRFGARVKLETSDGEVESWRIVGIDEADLSRGDISWMSPLAAALLDKTLNENLTFMKRRFKIVGIDYSET